MGLENDAEVEQYFATYNRGGYDDTDEEGGDDHDLLLPSMNDPKLFAVRCMFGFERETVVSLLNKFLYYEEQGSDHLQIYSVTSNDKFPGKIYIEADNEAHVRHAIKDTNNLTFKGNHRVKIVPIKEVPTIFIEDETKNIEVFS
jgi:transcription elongation factor SPT5